MNKFYLILFLIFYTFSIQAQNLFQLQENKREVAIPFELVNNLIILKVKLNSVPLNLILDTGIKQTLLINVKTTDSLNLKNLKKRNFTGVGNEQKIVAGLLSTNNNLIIANQIFNVQAKIYIITGSEFHFSENIGVSVNGFIGGELFKNFIVKIDYKKKILHFYKPDFFDYNSLKRYHYFSLKIRKGKPYIEANVQIHKNVPKRKLTFLIDTGNSDALWFFTPDKLQIPTKQKTIHDYFGLGFSGEIKGEKIKNKYFEFDPKYKFKHIYASIPDTVYFSHIIKNNPFDGLIGNEILRRFYVVFDYPNKSLYLKKYRHNYREPFAFNDTGIYLAYEGKIPVKIRKLETNFDNKMQDGKDLFVSNSIYTYVYELRNKIIIKYIRKDSPADRAGLAEGDVLLEINGTSVYNYRLDELEKSFFYHNKKKLDFLIKRKGLLLHFTVHNTSQL